MQRQSARPVPNLFGFSFLTGSTYVLIRTLGVSLFLARIGPKSLPAAIAVSAIVAIALSLATRAVMRRRSTAGCATVSWLLLAAASSSLAFAIGPFHHSIWALGAFYVLSEVRGCLGTIYVVALSNDALAGSKTKHPFAVVASGAPIAGVLVGLILGFEASVVHAMPILAIAAGLDVVTAALVWASRSRLASKGATRPATVYQNPGGRVTAQRVTGTYGLHLAALVALKTIALTMIGFQWKVVVSDHYHADEAGLVAYFALFYAISDVLIVPIQWLVSGKLLDRFGLGLGLLGFPIAIALIGVGALLSPSEIVTLVVFTAGKGLNVLRHSIHDPALTAAYTALDPALRRETIVTVKGVIKPFAEAATALALLFSGTATSSDGVTAVWLTLVGLWFFFAVKASVTHRARVRSPESH